MQPKTILSWASIVSCSVLLAGCLWEEGFEYQVKTTLDSINASGIKGNVIFGYGIGDWNNYRMRIAVSGLSRNVPYEVRLLNSSGCSESDLTHAKRIDAKRTDPDEIQEGWGFSSEQIILVESVWGRVEKEFRLSPPKASYTFGNWVKDNWLPTVVIYEFTKQKTGTEAVLKPVACGRISSNPTNQRPHT